MATLQHSPCVYEYGMKLNHMVLRFAWTPQQIGSHLTWATVTFL
jgi:hypothetical protein